MLKWNFELKSCLSVQTEIHVGCSDINDRGEGSSASIEAQLHRAKLHFYFFIERLIGLHGSHSAKACIAAALTMRIKAKQEKRNE